MWKEIYGKTTMIGSLPHSSAVSALSLLDKYPLGIPAWPQLPKRSFKEAMIPQYSEGFPGILVDEENKRIRVEKNDALLDEMACFYEDIIAEKTAVFAISPEYASGFHSFCEKLDKKHEKLPLVKGQVTGPFTFGLGMNDNEGKAVWFDEQYRDVVLKGLLMKAYWQIEKLFELAEKVIIFFDEPIFSALGTPAYLGIQDDDVVFTLNELVEGCHGKGAAVGIHCCGNMDWGLLARTAIDIIAFDAYSFGDKVTLYPDELTAFLDRGGILGWGIVPTLEPEKLNKETEAGIRKVYQDLLALFTKKGMSEQIISSQILFTPSCGMGSLKPEEAEKVLKLLSVC
ncbi:MAG: hypothetical protein JXB88_10015 [Spirochaetales bacterium]|nr:hypothetical protein [Spirochaetales bacterium]